VIGFKLVGGHPALDFVNTLGGAGAGTDEFLQSYGDLVAWAQQSALVDGRWGQRLRASARADAGGAATTLKEARRLRAHLDAVLRAHIGARDPDAADLDAIRVAYNAALAHGRLAADPPHYRWDWRTSDPVPASVLWPIAREIADLLTYTDLRTLKTCAACRWLYLDITRNHSRRWCTPDDCGVRARMRRYRATRRSGPP
jgi:predicted RNA-binding Zn ribbon-like protein